MSTHIALQNHGQVLFYQTDDQQIGFDVIFEHETVWLSQDQMAKLFDTTKQNISLHIRNVFQD